VAVTWLAGGATKVWYSFCVMGLLTTLPFEVTKLACWPGGGTTARTWVT
jgi:hypothetical protein